jgi:hypothetical protein
VAQAEVTPAVGQLIRVTLTLGPARAPAAR